MIETVGAGAAAMAAMFGMTVSAGADAVRAVGRAIAESDGYASLGDPIMLIPALAPIIVGLIILIPCIKAFFEKDDHHARCTAKIDGVVSEVLEDYDNDGTLWSPVFSYTVAGREYRIESGTWSRPCKLHKGDRVTVHYDPFEPSSAWVKEDRGVSILLIGFAGAAVLDILAGGALLVAWILNQ
ncbi:DUF3592 domain-containing protein [Bifidobacterium amazonense]|uniref:DUF3592 domain-containing protein n=1 Tax=Bifidobacterium amazonense TaxID=2809027 RepID=A0ABS9VXU9_9BIFI|nr:DUF3592 domain-containing protein [Bifidobacterium amazonense]MCH9276784.1 DUF3592 domain-containing protein [Bifidobacterium amazonense]